MSNKFTVYVLAGLVVVLGAFLLLSEFSKPVSFGGLVHNTQEIFSKGIKAGSSAAEVIDSSGNWVGSLSLSSSDTSTFAGTNSFTGATSFTSTVTIGSGGTAINKYICGSKTWNPDSIASSTDGLPGITTTTVAVSGATLGDVVLASFDSATSTEVWTISGKMTSSATATVTMVSYQTAALDLSTSTVKACVIK